MAELILSLLTCLTYHNDVNPYYVDHCAYAQPKLYIELSPAECAEHGGYHITTNIGFNNNRMCLVD